MLIVNPLFSVDAFPQMSKKYLSFEYSISKKTIYCLVSEVKGRAGKELSKSNMRAVRVVQGIFLLSLNYFVAAFVYGFSKYGL